MRRGESKAVEAVDRVHRLKQRDEGRFVLIRRDFALTVARDYLSKQRDLFDSSADQFAALGHNIRYASAALGAARVWHDAKGAILIAALHDTDKRGNRISFVAVEQVLANSGLAARLLRHIHDFIA